MSKGTIKSSPLNDPWGDGKIQEVTIDNGDKYIIKSSPLNDPWGDGKQKEIIKVNNSLITSEAGFYSILCIAGLSLITCIACIMAKSIKGIVIFGILTILCGIILPAINMEKDKQNLGIGGGAKEYFKGLFILFGWLIFIIGGFVLSIVLIMWIFGAL